MRDISGDKAWLVEALGGGRIVERDRLAAFVRDEATAFAANPFPSTTAGAARQRWGLREIEFEATAVASAGLPCLMAALAGLPVGEPLRQEIMRNSSHVLYLLRRGEGGPVIGAVLHGKPRDALPPFPPPLPVALPTRPVKRPTAKRPHRKATDEGQLHLFPGLTG